MFNHQKRFWSKINILSIDECWEWTKYRDKDGYGTFYFDGRSKKAHRYSYELYNNPIPKNMECCHRCPNPSCVNPNHLYIGSHLKNMQDMVNSGRSRNSLGEENTNTKLTDEEVRDMIDNVLKCKLKSKDDIIKYNPKFTKRIIKNINIKQCWSHIFNTYPIHQQEYFGDIINNYYTRPFIQWLKHEMLVNGLTNVAIEKKYGIERATASRIRNNKHKYS